MTCLSHQERRAVREPPPVASSANQTSPASSQNIPTIYRSSALFYRQSITFIDCPYRFQVIHAILQTIHNFCTSFVWFTGLHNVLQTIHIAYRSILQLISHSYHFTYYSYHLQAICTILQTIHSNYRSFIPFTGCPNLFTTIHSLYISFLTFTGNLYHFTDHSHLLQCSNPKSSSLVLEENVALCLYAE